MSALSIQPTYPIFTDIDGQPLEDGYVWIGTANLDPQTNPIQVYWDAALTLPASQPIRTLAGYPANSGTPARLYVNSDYSIRVMNKDGSVVYSAPAATERYSNVVVNGVRAISVKDAPYNAVGDGITDDTAAIQNAINYVNSIGGGELFFPAGAYAIKSAKLQLLDKVQLVGSGSQCTTLDFSGQTSFASSTGFIQITGGGLGSVQTVTASAAEGATSITVNTPTVSAGDIIQIRSTEFYDGRVDTITAVAYAPLTAYSQGNIVWSNYNWYVCTTAGTSGAASAPSGTVNPISDGTVTWYYAPLTDATYQTPWVATTAKAVGDIVVSTLGRIYVCVVAGTTGSTEPSSTSTSSLVIDGTVSWRYVTRYGSRKAEFAIVQFVSGSTVNLTQPLKLAYPQSGASSYTVEIAPVSFAKASIRGFTINGKGMPSPLVQNGGFKYNFTGPSADIGIDSIWASIDIFDVKFTNVEQIGIQLQSCYDCSIKRFRIINNPKNLGSQQYGIWAARCTTNLRIDDYYGENCRHIISTDGSTSLTQDYYRGVPCGIVMTNGSGDGIWQSAVDTHAGGLDIVANGGVFNTIAAGVKFRSKHTSISNFLINSLTDGSSGYSDGGVSIYYDGGEITMSNIVVRGGYYGLRFSNVSSNAMGRIVASNILISNPAGYGIRIGNNPWDVFGSINISNITIKNPAPTYYCAYLIGQFDQVNINGISTNGGVYGFRTDYRCTFNQFVMGNFNLKNSTNTPLYLENLKNFSVSNGSVSTTSLTASNIYMRNSLYGAVSNVAINLNSSSSNAIGVFLSAASAGSSDYVSLDNVVVHMPSGTAYGVYLEDNVTNCTVGQSCDVRSCSTPIRWGSGSGHRGGYLTGSTTYDPVSLSPGSGVTATVSIPGAQVGDAVIASFSSNLQGITLSAAINISSQASVRFQNTTSSAIDLPSGTIRATAFKI